MEEGERLSIKQGNMESTIKKLRSQIKELEASHTQTTAKLAAEESKLEATTKARQKAEAAAAAAQQQHKAESEQQKQHYEALLKQAHSSQVCGNNCCAEVACMQKSARWGPHQMHRDRVNLEPKVVCSGVFFMYEL